LHARVLSLSLSLSRSHAALPLFRISCIATGSRRQVYILHKRAGRAGASYTGPRRIKSFARRSRYFITFLYFEKRAVAWPPTSRIQMSARVHTPSPALFFARAHQATPRRVYGSSLEMRVDNSGMGSVCTSNVLVNALRVSPSDMMLRIYLCVCVCLSLSLSPPLPLSLSSSLFHVFVRPMFSL